MKQPIVIVGAGLAGLCCARRLRELEIPFTIVEASDGVGGRVRTDVVDGFRLDRGFQIYLPSYPEGRRVLDYDALELKPFTRGALIRFNGGFHRVADPRVEFVTALKSVFGPVGSARDKLRLASFTNDMMSRDVETTTDQPALDLLRVAGFSDAMIDRLFRPFLGGVFLESELRTSARFLRFVWRMFAAGPGAVPALGMQRIPEQITALLPKDSVRLNAAVSAVVPGAVVLTGGERVEARGVVVATGGPAANRLLGEDVPAMKMNGTVTLYYAAATPPTTDPILVLNGEGQGPVNNLVVMSAASEAYAPAGQSLMAVSVLGIPDQSDGELEAVVRNQLVQWYGESARAWRHLRSYRIPDALPDMSTGSLDPWRRPVRLRPGLYVCGDHRDQSSINGAMESGHRAAQAVGEDVTERRV
jgi:protoporphyrinogen oxidase